ncbi:helix-turn-helix transcriptional regulator [Vallitalea pronyensis]|uniref:Helix-turn-helix transcriptional regulator n=1 Tax=Vallitalea pronyensis TaxID=1348613 RepID=A0A8J8MJD6_9FIRM|nr:helix-turn-helix transcriptional regulator [Vallitalea pronyensis]QUI22730.1 helix-turn-helix transcriptional regulator [Vallitalea pronyensis]
MALNDNIKKRRLELGMTLETLANMVDTTRQTIQRYESGVISNIPQEKIEKLAIALKTTPTALMGWDQISMRDWYYLEQKLAQIGHTIQGIESEGYLWLEYPDGVLEISEKDLAELDKATTSFLKFKLAELKEQNIKNFKKRK